MVQTQKRVSEESGTNITQKHLIIQTNSVCPREELSDSDGEDEILEQTLKIQKQLSEHSKNISSEGMSAQINQNELSKHYMEKGMEVNFHRNFVDLNPVYHQQRHQRAIRVADRYLSVIKNRLLQMYKIEARKNFRKWVADGNKLSFEQLQELKEEEWKVDYITHQLLEDDVVK